MAASVDPRGRRRYSEHALLHLQRADCVGDRKQTARHAPQHTSVQRTDLEISFIITHYLLHVLGQRLFHRDNKLSGCNVFGCQAATKHDSARLGRTQQAQTVTDAKET
ncbi:hypothetical protein EYF80_039272 [Liparis tanakae]|uniref:Uncharacterized protein n=1 Tax=Liparis tanakae TaxID=230148 RepID=A0A4Z2GC66_9TELE|nr:hypothetical protein EYF80_039272 [Liparis tanakae]